MSRIPQTRMSLSSELRKQRNEITNKGTTWTGTGIHFPSPGVVQVDGEFRGAGFDGDLANDDVGTTGFALSATKAAMPELLLRPGSIGNDSLTQPVVPGVVNAVATNISVSAGTWGTVASQAVTVPAGCTQLLAHVTGSVYSVNPNTTGGTNGSGGDILEARAGVGSVDGLGMAVSISGSNGQTSVTATVAALLTGLTPGSSVTLRTQAMSGLQNFGSNPTAQANCAATLLWLR